MSAGAVGVWRLDWGWRICFQGSSFTWLLAGGPSSLSHERLMGLLELLRGVVAGASSLGKQDKAALPSRTRPLRLSCQFHTMLSGAHVHPVGGCEYQQVQTIGSHPGGWLPR